MSFRLKTILGVALIEASLLIILVWSSINMMRESNEALLLQRAESTSQLFVSMIKDPVLSFDLATLETSVQELMTSDGMAYVQVWGYGQLLTSGGTLPSATLRGQLHGDSGYVDDKHLFITKAPIEVDGEPYGRIEIGFNVADIKARLATALYNTSALALAEILLSALFSYLLGSWLVRQLADLRTASKAISAGDYTVQIPVRGKDEIAQTASLFNEMSASLLATTNALQELNQSLEHLVEERTADLSYSNRSLENIIQAMSDALIVVDEDGHILRSNPAFHRFTGITEAQLSDYSLPRLLSSVGRISAGDLIAHGEQTQHEMQLRTRANKFIPVLVNSATIDSEQTTHWVINIQDLRDVKRAEELERFRAFKDGGEEVRIDVAHNLGNALTSISTQLHTMEQQREAINRLQRGLHNYMQLVVKDIDHLPNKGSANLEKLPKVLDKTTHLMKHLAEQGMGNPSRVIGEVVEDIAQLFQVSAGRTTKAKSLMEFGLRGLCEDVGLSVYAQLQARRCELTYTFDEQVRVSMVPRNQFAKVWQLLLENAMEAMPNGGDITIGAIEEAGHLLISITDQGTGMTPEVLASAIQRNFSTRVGTHAGNGLHDTANFMHQLDGEVLLENMPHRGLRVTLKIPQLMNMSI